MKILYYDCFSGISGDMNLGALADLGVDKEYLMGELSKLGLDNEFRLTFRKDIKNGITGTRAEVVLTRNENGHHGHGDHHNRNLKDIEDIILGSSLNEKVKKMSIDMFRIIAEAEAKVHGKPVSEVHFHEVGAVDSIVDMVGAAIAIDYLNIDKIISSPVQLGGGFVKCAHGMLPVPAPATVEILHGIPVKSGMVQFETTTPTGAAILASNVDEFTDKMEFVIEKTGYGTGSRDLEIPNVLRVYLGSAVEDYKIKEQFIIETNIDDMNPEIYGYVEERLFEAGALDVFMTPVIMKKGRPAIKLSILFEPENGNKLQEVIFRETTSIGLRKYKIEKIELAREFIKLNTQLGDITVKKIYRHGEMIRYKAEYEECKTIARDRNIPISEVYDEVDKVMRKRV